MTLNNTRYLTILFISLLFLIQSCGSSVSITNNDEVDSKSFLIKDLPYATKNISQGKLNNLQLLKLKKHLNLNYKINLDEIEYLTISYLKPKKKCWYDNLKFLNTKYSNKRINKLRTQLNSEILFLHSDDKQKYGESKVDKNLFIYNLFPESVGDDFCDYTVSISYNGNYFFKISHFYVDVANALKNELELLD